MKAPLVPVALAFAGGIALGLEAPPPRWVLTAAGVLALLAGTALRQDRLVAASAAVLVLIGLAGWARVALPGAVGDTSGVRPGLQDVEGIVGGDPEVDGPRTRLPLFLQAVADEAGRRPAAGHLVLLLYGAGSPVGAGDRVRASVDVTAIRPFRNPGLVDHDPRPPPRGRPLVAVGRASALRTLPAAGIPWWLRVRLWIHRVVQAHLPPVSGALFEGLLIGERRRLPPTLTADFRAAGVFHILAISGFNVALVAAAIFVVLRLVHCPPRVAAAVALPALIAFAVVVGDQPSVWRATLMGGLGLAAQLVAREGQAWNGLAAALLALLAWEPGALANPGLQLSFAATAGILHLAPWLRERLPRRAPRGLATALAASASAQLAVTPLLLVHWNQLSLAGIGANLVVVPLAGLVTVLGLVAMLVAAIDGAVAHLLFQSLWLVLVALRGFVRAVAALPGGVLETPAPPALAVAAATAALLLLPATGRHGRRGRLLFLVLALAGVAGGLTALRLLPDGSLRVLMLDVGQGDAILVRGPDGRALLVDTAGGGPGRSDRGARVVLPALRRAGVRRLDVLVLTHNDPDHVGGLAGLLEGLPVDEIWLPAGTEGSGWAPAVWESGLARPLRQGDRRWLGPVLVTVLHPGCAEPCRAPPGPRDDNDTSLVLRLEWGGLTLLLAGDAEAPAEDRMLDTGLPVAATVLKVGHHGSRHASSAAFLAAVEPRLALISVGRRNAFGHPAPDALARLATAGAVIYRTDLDGAVELESDGERLFVRRWAYPGPPQELRLSSLTAKSRAE